MLRLGHPAVSLVPKIIRDGLQNEAAATYSTPLSHSQKKKFLQTVGILVYLALLLWLLGLMLPMLSNTKASREDMPNDPSISLRYTTRWIWTATQCFGGSIEEHTEDTRVAF